jgi:CubicO group peptidase (beta-lactamase class C family)
MIIVILLISSSFIPTSAKNINFGKKSVLEYNQNDFLNDNLFDKKISFLIKFLKFPSLTACIIKDDDIIWSKGYGYYDLRNMKEADPNTIYVIASITKTIVGTALMQLYEQGLFSLDEDVNNYLPFSLRNPNFPEEVITFRMLLSHTSSLNTNTRNEYYWVNFSGDPPYSFFPEPYLEEFLIPGGKYYHDTVWSDTVKPGGNAMYANIGFDIISFLVEIISGESFLEYCQSNIFNPLDMYNTSFNLSTLNLDNVAIPYHYYQGEYYQINELSFIYGEETPPQPYWKIRCYPAGGLYTTINDLSHFLIAHMNDGIYQNIRILEKDTVALMHTINPDNEIKYGLAWMERSFSLRHSATGHGGDLVGADTWMLYMPSENIGIIYFANGNAAFRPFSSISYYATSILLFLLFNEAGVSTNLHPSFLLIKNQYLDYSTNHLINNLNLLY